MLLCLVEAAAKDDARRAQQARDEPPAHGRQGVGVVEVLEAGDEAAAQTPVEDAAANGGAEAAAEAPEGGDEAGGDVLGVLVAEVEGVGEGVVEAGAHGEAVDEDDGDKDGHRVDGRPDQREAVQTRREEGHGDDGRQPVGAVAADVQPADDDAAEPEAHVGRDEDGARRGGSEAADGQHEDGRVVQDAPAGRHEAELREAREQDAPRREHLKRDDGLLGHAVLDDEEEHQRSERDEERQGLNVTGEAVEEENNGGCLNNSQ